MRLVRAALVLALFGCGGAPPPPPPRTQAPAPEAPPEVERRPILIWSVESPDGRVSYVLGTMHLGVHLADAVPAEHVRALNEARLVVAEMDLPNFHSPAIAQHSQLPRGRDLRALLPRELWPRLVEAFAPSIPERALRRLRPWAVMAALMSREAAALQAEREGDGDAAGRAPNAPPASLDIEVMWRAQGRDIAIQGLETVDEQAALMSSLPHDDVVDYIRHALIGGDTEQVTLRDLTDAYLRADVAALEAMVLDPDEIARSPAVYETLFYARNERWLVPLEPELARGGVFVAVGLGHLLGERGLLALLERRGYRVERLTAR
jgi:uncharacterized protein YbaP (TraB family)